MNKIDYIWPVANSDQNDITSPYGNRDDPLNPGVVDEHKGIDIAPQDALGTPVAMIANGIIVGVSTKDLPGTGRFIVYETDCGLRVNYFHLEAVNCVFGRHYEAGTPIGSIGSTGASTNPHLHFQVCHIGDESGASFDPMTLWESGEKDVFRSDCFISKILIECNNACEQCGRKCYKVLEQEGLNKT